jgi:hypothetical protein
MVKRMDKGWKRVPAGTFAGKKITIADTEGVDAHAEIASEFIRTIFDFEPGDYVISDESDILDFMSFDESDTSDVWRRIERAYGLTQVEVGSGRLVQIFRAISGRRGTQ